MHWHILLHVNMHNERKGKRPGQLQGGHSGMGKQVRRD